MQEEHVVDESRGPYFPFNRRETYPKRLKVDFRRLPINTLLTYTAHHDLHVRPDSTHEELAIAAARHFAAWRVNEDAIMRSFCAGLAASTIGTPRRSLGDDERAAADLKRRRLDDSLDAAGSPSPSCERSPERSPERSSFGGGVCVGRAPRSSSPTPPRPQQNRSRTSTSGGAGSPGGGRRGGGGGGLGVLARGAAGCRSSDGYDYAADLETGEQVAAYVVRKTEEEGLPPRAWILARVVQFKPHGKVELHDEDDASHVFDLPYSEVMPLEDFSSELRKHDKVLAVFPDTTIFYSATVAKDTPRMQGNRKVVLVYFEDDEDADGICQYRRIPVEHILPENGYGHGHPFRYGNGYEGGSHGGVGGGGGRSGRGSKSARAGSRRSASPRVRAGYGGGGAAGNTHLHGGAASVVSRVSGGGSAAGGGGGRASNGNGSGSVGSREQQGSKKGGATYADMIAHSLGKVENGRGAFTEICDIIESKFSEFLNWKLESDVRRTPVWKSSVRKILFSNSRFHHHSTTPEHGHVFTLARPTKK